MSNYKVGDLASLMCPSLKKSGNKLQSLFDEHWNKKHNPNAVKKAKKMKASQKSPVPGCDIESNVTQKTKKEKVTEVSSTLNSPKKEIKTDFFIPDPNKKKQSKEKNSNFERKRKKRFSKNSVVENKKQIVEDPQNCFIRSTKDKRQKTDEPKESNFNDTWNYQSQKQKTNQSMDTVSATNAEKLQNIKDLTLFVGNLPLSVNRKMLHKLFVSFGQIKSVRLRGAVSTKLNIPKRVAEIKREYHKGLQSHTGFVVFRDEESAKAAISLNGTLIDNHHIVVDFANQAGEKKLYSNDLSLFLGNLPFDVDDETVRSAFEECGEIQAVRIVRDKSTGLGKGFGYVQFQEIKSKEKALTLKDVEINGRKIRVKPIDNYPGKKAGPKKTVMMIRNNMAMKRNKESGKSVKKLLRKGKRVHKKKQIARVLGGKFVE